MTQHREATGAGRSRVPLWDNARFICVTLVVIGHGTQRLTAGSDAALSLYLFIYAFHMPAFAIISGYFSKSSPPNERQLRRVITDILVPYLLMESIWTLVQFLVEGKRGFDPATPSWTLWFLLALGVFRVALPYLALLRWPLTIAVLLSVGVGYLPSIDSTLSLSRAFGILPFFVLGWRLKNSGLVERWRMTDSATWQVRVAAAAALAAWLAAVIVFIGPFRDGNLRFWLFYDESYAGLGETAWWAGLVRLGLIALSVILSAAFFVLVPRRETWLTSFGQATMYVYLLHSFVLYPIRESGILSDQSAAIPWLITMVLASIGISIALSSPVVRRVFRPIIEPNPVWLFAERRQ